jgi:hypothetical protein
MIPTQQAILRRWIARHAQLIYRQQCMSKRDEYNCCLHDRGHRSTNEREEEKEEERKEKKRMENRRNTKQLLMKSMDECT